MISTKIRQVLIDIFIFVLSLFAAYFIRFEELPKGVILKQLLVLFPYVALARVLSFYLFSIYSFVWRYISANNVISIGKACVPVTALLFLGRIFLPDRLSLLRVPLSIIALEFLFALFGTL